MKCPNCRMTYGRCPECDKRFDHGTASNCDEPGCVGVNAPIDCICGLVVAKGAKGILTLDGNFLPFFGVLS